METTEQTFKMPVARVPWLRAKLDELEKRARKLGTSGASIGCETIRTIVEEHRDEITAFVHKRTFAEVRVWGPAPRINGWSLIGRLDFVTAPGAVLAMMVPGETCPVDFHDRASAWRCDHCNTRRERSDTFLVRHEDGSIKIVGRSCLADFLGHHSPEWFAKLAEIMGEVAQAGEYDEAREGGSRGWGGWDLREVLTVACYCVRAYGWLSTKAAYEKTSMRSTKSDVFDLITPVNDTEAENDRRRTLAQITERDHAKSEAIIDWLLAVDGAESDYMGNLAAIAQAGCIADRGLGLAVSAVVAHDKHCEREIEHKRREERKGQSEHVGAVKDKLSFEGEIVMIRYAEGQYGTTGIFRFLDTTGNVYTWFASNGGPDLHQGDRVAVKGTVKKHEEYRGEKQTVLTRCKVEVL